jgi:hypothetical protein
MQAESKLKKKGPMDATCPCPWQMKFLNNVMWAFAHINTRYEFLLCRNHARILSKQLTIAFQHLDLQRKQDAHH